MIYVATFYAPGSARLADGTRPTAHTAYCAANGVPLGSTAEITVNGRTYRLVVRDRMARRFSGKRIDLPSRCFRERFGERGMRRGCIPCKVRFTPPAGNRNRGKVHKVRESK